MAAGSKVCLLPWVVILFGWIADTACGQNDPYVDAGGKRFTIVLKERDWYQANIDCVASGMSLAAIETAAEYTALKNYLISSDLFGEEFWLAGSNLAGGTGYTWLTTGRKFRYTEWKASKPGSDANVCVYSDAGFKWDSVACSGSKYYICARPLVPYCGVTGRCKRSSNFN